MQTIERAPEDTKSFQDFLERNAPARAAISKAEGTCGHSAVTQDDLRAFDKGVRAGMKAAQKGN